MSAAHQIAPEVPGVDVSAAYSEHGPFIGRVIRRLIGEGPDVDDLLQETFVTAFRAGHKFAGRARLRTWLYGIAANLCMRHNRGRRRFRLFWQRLSGEPKMTATPPDHLLERHRLTQALREAVAQLPFAQREVYVLYELEELEGRDVAALIGAPLATVWTRLHRARKKVERRMRRTIKERHGDS